MVTQVMSVEEPLNFEQEKDHKKWMKVMKNEKCNLGNYKIA